MFYTQSTITVISGRLLSRERGEKKVCRGGGGGGGGWGGSGGRKKGKKPLSLDEQKT